MRLAIRTKLLLLFFALAIAPLALVGIISYYNSIRSIEVVLEQRTQKHVDNAATEITALFTQRQNEVALLARNQPIQQFFVSSDLSVRPALIDTFFAQFFSGPRRAFVQATYFNAEGLPILSYARGADNNSTNNMTGGGYAFTKQLPARIDLSTHPADTALLSNVHSTTHGPILRLSRWINDVSSGERVGYLQADLSVRSLLEDQVEDFPIEASEFLLIVEGQQNRLLFHPHANRIGQPAHLLLPAFAPALARLQQSQDGWERFNDGQQDWLVSYANNQTLDWSIAILSQPTTFTAPVRRAGLFNLSITFAAVLLALILVPWTINRITRSIRKVTEGAEAIAAGDLDQHIDVDSRDETRLLADAFNRMSASLKKTLGDLQALTEELEDRVERRTAQLAKSNHQLEEINAQLEVANREIQAGTQRKSAFLASMSHDLRTPMNAIIGYTRILLRKAEGALEPRLYRNLGNIETSSNNLLALINEILDLSRVESGRVEIKATDVDLKQLVEECAASVEPLVKEGVVLQQTLADVPTIATDGELLRRVLMNLLGNAVKFTERGTITLSVQSAADGVAVSVADTGVGIPAKDLPYIFEEFRQVDRDGAEAQGSGLGLAIVKKTVELLGGTIKAESSVGEGTRFTLIIGNYKQ